MVTAIGFFLPMAFFPEWAGDETSEDNTGQCTYGIGGQVEPITGPVGGAIGLCQFDEATHGYRAYVKGKGTWHGGESLPSTPVLRPQDER
jgi:hypothetical protein